MPARSPSAASRATAAASLSTGRLSPVSAASCACRLRARISRRSAGTLSPLARCTRSPGTSSSAGTLWRRPSRVTEACGDSMREIAASAFSALPSWTKPMMALITTTPRITAVSTQ